MKQVLNSFFIFLVKCFVVLAIFFHSCEASVV